MEDLISNKDTSYHYSPIAYHESWLSVDPIVGCQLNCQYCYMQMTRWTGVKRPQQVYSIPRIVELLLDHRYFIPHQTVLCFGNQTDAFLPDNVGPTLEFFKTLDAHGLRNPVAVVTKNSIPDHFIDETRNLEHIKPIFFISYSGLSKDIEKGVNPEEIRRNFQNLSKYHLPAIHFWRPLLQINGTNETLLNVLDFVSQYAIASVYIGLKLNPRLNSIFNKNPFLQVPEALTQSYGDYIADGVENRLRSLARQKYPDYPLYKYTSCAVSLALSIPDYNAALYTDPVCKGSECPVWKRRICEKARNMPTKEQIVSLLAKLELNYEFQLTGDAVEIFGEINQEDFAFLLHQLNYPLIAKELRQNRVLRGAIYQRR